MSLGENINRLRREKLMSQIDLADALDVSRQSVSKWESDSSTPELEKLLAMSELFGVSLDELVKGEKPAEKAQEDKTEVPAGSYCLVLTKNIHDKEAMLRLLQEEFNYSEEVAKRLIDTAPSVIKRDLSYQDASNMSRELSEVAWLKILHDEDAWNPVKVREGESVSPTDTTATQGEADSMGFGGTVLAVVVGVVLAVIILSIF